MEMVGTKKALLPRDSSEEHFLAGKDHSKL